MFFARFCAVERTTLQLFNSSAPCWVGIIQQLVVSLNPGYKEIDFNNKYVTFCVFSFSAQKTLKMTISTSVWGGKHPNAFQNIQHSAHFLLLRLQLTLCYIAKKCFCPYVFLFVFLGGGEGSLNSHSI